MLSKHKAVNPEILSNVLSVSLMLLDRFIQMSQEFGNQINPDESTQWGLKEKAGLHLKSQDTPVSDLRDVKVDNAAKLLLLTKVEDRSRFSKLCKPERWPSALLFTLVSDNSKVLNDVSPKCRIVAITFDVQQTFATNFTRIQVQALQVN